MFEHGPPFFWDAEKLRNARALPPPQKGGFHLSYGFPRQNEPTLPFHRNSLDFEVAASEKRS
jgi:hypothetical protein